MDSDILAVTLLLLTRFHRTRLLHTCQSGDAGAHAAVSSPLKSAIICVWSISVAAVLLWSLWPRYSAGGHTGNAGVPCCKSVCWVWNTRSIKISKGDSEKSVGFFFFFAEEDSSSSIGFTSVTIDPDGDSEIYLKKENKMWVKIFIETFQTAPPPWPIFPLWICTFSVFQTVIALPIRTKHNTLSSNTDTVLHERSVNNHSVLCCVVLNNMRREVTVDVLTLI